MIIFSGIIQAFWGLMQLKGYAQIYNSNFIITGNFSNPGPYCGFLAIVFVMSYGILVFRVNFKEYIVEKYFQSGVLINSIIIITSISAIISITAVFIYINSRASILSILSGCIIIFLSRNNYFKIARTKKNIGFTIFLVIISFCCLSLWNKRTDSANGRILIWKVSAEMIKNNTLTGVGFDNVKAFYMDYQAQYFQENRGTNYEKKIADDIYYVFNEFLQYTLENGLIGTSLLFLSGLFYIQTKLKNKLFKIYITAIIVSIIIFSSFSYPSHVLPIKIIFIFCLASVSRESKAIFYEFSLDIFSNKNRMLFVSLITVFMFTFCYQIILSLNQLKKSYEMWNIAMINYDNGNFGQSKINFELALPTLERNGDFLMNYGKTCTLLNENQKSIFILKNANKYLTNTVIEIALGNAYKSLGNYKKSEESYKQAAFMTPNRFYPLYLLAKLYEESGQILKAKQIAREILNKQIKVNSTAIEEIKEEMNQILDK